MSLIYGFCPVVMHNSFQALSDVSYAFFVLSSMYFLSEGLKHNGKTLFAILGGFAMTLAAATRYEAWVIIATFTLVGILNKQWKFTAVFWFIAMLFPVSWMLGNHLEHGDFLYSITQNDIGNIQKQGINDKVDDILRMRRMTFFPFSFIVNVSPIAVLLILIAITSSVWRKSISKMQLTWLVPFLILAVVFIQKTYVGTLMMQHRFTITWIILLLPFLALTFSDSVLFKLKSVILTLAVISLAPMSFKWGWVNYKEYLGKGTLGEAFNQMNAENSHEFEAIPFLYNADTDSLVGAIRVNSMPNDGFVLDFFGWDRTYYTSLRAKMRGIIVDGSKHGNVDYDDLNKYLTTHPTGLIVLSRLGKLLDGAEYRDSLFYFQNMATPLNLTQLYATSGELLFRYKTLENYDSNKFVEKQAARDKLFGTERDAAFFEVVIKADMNWYRRLQREGYWKGDPIDTTLAQNARYMVQMEAQRKKGN